MKICMPIAEDQALQSMPYSHFGSAPFFIVYNTEDSSLYTINNGDLHHEHGMCQPTKALCGENIDVILVGGIGKGALMKLSDIGIQAYRAGMTNFEENIQLFQSGKLSPFDSGHVCTSHDCGHHE